MKAQQKFKFILISQSLILIMLFFIAMAPVGMPEFSDTGKKFIPGMEMSKIDTLEDTDLDPFNQGTNEEEEENSLFKKRRTSSLAHFPKLFNRIIGNKDFQFSSHYPNITSPPPKG